MKRYFIPILTLKDKISEMLKQNKRFSELSSNIYNDMNLPNIISIKTNTDRLEIGGVGLLHKDLREQFNKPNAIGNSLAKQDSELNKQWLYVVKKYELKHYSKEDFLIKILNTDLILECGEIFVLPNLGTVIISSESRKESDFTNMKEIKESEFFEKRMLDAKINESKFGGEL